MTVREFTKQRSSLQNYTWFGLPLVIIGGWFYPKFGYLLLGCMIGALGIAAFRGRTWCNWMCPRGSFYDLFLGKVSSKKKVSAFFRNKSVRITVVIVLISILSTLLYRAWGDVDGMGHAMVLVLTVTTVIGSVLGIVYQERAWCHICPMGTLANFVSEGKFPLYINSSCRHCDACEMVCPMQLNPAHFKNTGIMGDNDCIKCSLCVIVCPNQALQFQKYRSNSHRSQYPGSFSYKGEPNA